jgi:hypothetical protein
VGIYLSLEEKTAHGYAIGTSQVPSTTLPNVVPLALELKYLRLQRT